MSTLGLILSPGLAILVFFRAISLMVQWETGVDPWKGSLLMDIVVGTLILTLIFAFVMERRK